jgi:putative membrane protein
MSAWKHSLAVLGLASLAALPLTAQTPPAQPAGQSAKPAGTAAAGKLSAADNKFVHEAAVGGMAEVSLGKLAADKATNPDVKQFAQRMVDDHSKANDELKAYASQKGVTLPADTDAAHKAVEARLSKLSGEAFDKAYMADMVKDHDKDVAAFKQASSTASDADLKAWAAKTLPTLQEHQKMAHSLHTKVGSAGAAKKPGQ